MQLRRLLALLLVLVRRQKTFAARAAFGAEASSALDFTGLLVEFANPHFLLDTAALDELTEAADSLLGRLLVTQSQLNHMYS
jgi:hypothetical protein